MPCYAVEKGNWKSAADRSQYHTEYMTKKFNQGSKGSSTNFKKIFKNYWNLWSRNAYLWI
jgi:tRNA nucleotidyltransferase (CCA-adding enzyme)